MNRKAPLRTYQKKKTGQSAICYSQPKFVEQETFSKRKSNNGTKNKSQDDKSIEESFSFNLDSTFDKIAKTAKLPPPPLTESYCTINLSSDVPVNEPSPFKTDIREYPWSKEIGKSKATRRVKRKPAHSGTVHVDGIFKTKRFKHDFINTSTKKDKAVKSSRKKVCSKADKSVNVSGVDQEINFDCSTLINSIEPFVIQPVKNTENVGKQKKTNGYRLRRKAKANRILRSSSDSDVDNFNTDVYKEKIKPQKEKNLIIRPNADSRKLRVSDYVDTSRELQVTNNEGEEENPDDERELKTEKEKGSPIESRYSVNTSRITTVSHRTRSRASMKSSSASEFVENFRKYSASKSRENKDLNPVDSDKCDRISTRKEYTKKRQRKLRQKNKARKPLDPVDASNNSNTPKTEITPKRDSENLKSFSIVLLGSNENKNILSRKESAIVTQNSNNKSSQDIFQSSISNNASHIERETNEAIKIILQESAVTVPAKSIKTRSHTMSNLGLDTKVAEAKIAIENMDRKLQCDLNRSLHYLKCSTPINAHIKIDKTINSFSPITATHETFDKDGNFEDVKEACKLSAVNCSGNGSSSNNKCVDLPKTITRHRSARKRLSISYKQDKSGISNEYCEENVIAKMPVQNVKNSKYSSGDNNAEQMQSPTSQIQKSLQILKLSLDNAHNNSNEDSKMTNRSSRKQIVPIENNDSCRISGITEKGDYMNELTGQSKDSCFQLTPVGIITTRSRRQLKLNATMQKNFLNGSNDSEIHPNTDIEIIEDSQTLNNRKLSNRITKHRQDQFTVMKSQSKCKISEQMRSFDSTDMFAADKNDSHEIQPIVNVVTEQRSNNSTSYKSRNLNASQKSQTISVHSNRLNIKSGNESRTNDSTSSLDEENNNRSMSLGSNSDNECARSYDHKISQSIVESTKNLDSLNIRSDSDVRIEISCDDDNNDDSEWSTFSSSDNAYSITCDPEDKVQKKDLLTNLSSSQSRSLLISDQKQAIAPSNTALDNSFKIAVDQSPEHTDTALIRRMELLSSRINTRKRQKEVLESLTENVFQVIEEEKTPIQSSDHSTLADSVDVYSKNGFDSNECDKIESIAPSLAKLKSSDLCEDRLDVYMNSNLQPVVLLERLEDPPRITTSEKKNLCSVLTAIHKTPYKTSETIHRDFDFLSVPNDCEVNHDDGDFEKSDPLYCPPKNSEEDNSLFKARIISTLQPNAGSPNLHVKIPEKITRQSVLESLHEMRTRRSLPRRSKESNPLSESNFSISQFNENDMEMKGRQSLFLKPGKEYARSLSILNSIHYGSDLEQLSSGKGKNWRKSVLTIFAMQENGLIKSCLAKNGNDKNELSCHRALSCSTIRDTQPCSEEQSAGSASPSRINRRMSIRVVPDNKRLSNIEDTSFLEAYGITASKSRKTLCRSSEIETEEKSLSDNVQCIDTAIESVKFERIVTPRDVVLQRCNQDNYLPFGKCFPSSYLDNCRKIGEGVYGEVFLYENNEEKSVIKIIPIQGEALVNGERQKRFDEILSEIVIAKELHNLRYGDKNRTHGFVGVKNIRCIKGKYPQKLINLWKAYDNEKGSDNDCPAMFDRHQLYIVLELAHGGEDLEAFVFNSAAEAHALFVQTAVALAVAEQSLEFEHRDLHWGNVLISETKDTEIAYRLNDQEYKYPTKGLQVAIIDFTLSRMSYDGCCIFNDLALDPALFTAQGEYQFEIYRLMRDKVGNNWQEFEPYTNILWLHYTLDKMMTSLRYKRIYARGHREGMFSLHALKEIVLNYESAFDFVTNCENITNLQSKSATETTEKPIPV